MLTTILVIILIIAGLRFFLPLIWKLIVFLFSLVYASFYSIIKLVFIFFVFYLCYTLLFV